MKLDKNILKKALNGEVVFLFILWIVFLIFNPYRFSEEIITTNVWGLIAILYFIGRAIKISKGKKPEDITLSNII